MARPDGDAIPVMDRANVKKPTTRGAGAATTASSPRKGRARTLAGPWKASFDGTDGFGNQVPGLTFERRWTRPGVHPYDEIAWELRERRPSPTSRARSSSSRRTSRSPAFWSQLATNVVVSKYFRGHVGTPERETSVRQLIDRVVNTIAAWAETQRYFATDEDLRRLQGRADPPARPPEDGLQLARLVQRRHRGEAAVLGLLHQLGRGHDVARSWTWPRPRPCSSSTAPARAPTCPPSARSKEKLTGGGTASRPGQLHEGLRRLRRRHQVGRQDPPRGQDGDPRRRPPGRRWSSSTRKLNEEKKAWALIEPATTRSFTGEAYGSVFFQNANNSVRVTDEFMQAGSSGRGLDDPRRRRRQGRWTRYKARDIFRKMAEAAWVCGDPGIQYDTTINDWHTSANTDRINASQPVLRVHVPRRHGLQPGLAEPHEVRARRTASSTSRPTATRRGSRSRPRRSSSTTRATRRRQIEEN